MTSWPQISADQRRFNKLDSRWSLPQHDRSRGGNDDFYSTFHTPESAFGLSAFICG